MNTSHLSKRIRRVVAYSSAVALTLGAFAAHAQRIYVNDVDVSTAQLKNWSLDRVDKVEFDDEGNVRISAPAYNVQVVPNTQASGASTATPAPAQPARSGSTPKTPTTPPNTPTSQPERAGAGRGGPMTIHYRPEVTMAHRYLLTLSNPNRGDVPYDVDVVVNGKHVVTYAHDRGNSALDISSYVRPGNNAVSFVARRKPGAAVSHAGGKMSVMLGVGSYDGRAATYDHILLGMEYTQADPDRELRNSLNFRIEN